VTHNPGPATHQLINQCVDCLTEMDQMISAALHCKEIWIYVFTEKELRGLCVCERSIYSHVQSTYFPATEEADRLGELYINRSQKHECRN
jgi:predicted metal-binding protein